MQILQTPQEVKLWRKNQKEKSIGFVPTMGALHEAHAQLLRRARAENDLVVLTVFVNPTQFNDPKDLLHYPRTWEADCEIAKREKVDLLWSPEPQQMYEDNYRYTVIEKEFSKILCGQDRPGHFDGVLTVIMKLLNVISPHNIYLGEKDFQQFTLIDGMVKAFFMDVNVISVSTVRAEDGTALSSRNLRLTPTERQLAPQFHAILCAASSPEEAKSRLISEMKVDVDYVEEREGRRFGAIRLGQVRLIDNVKYPL